jgi:hypothetical protein
MRIRGIVKGERRILVENRLLQLAGGLGKTRLLTQPVRSKDFPDDTFKKPSIAFEVFV